jgi:ubiquinone/menaquinone biosynthesis C-methylase UbiE
MLYDTKYYQQIDSSYRDPMSLASKKLDIIMKEIRGGDNILDIGCGTGEFLFRSADKFLSLVGIDASPGAIEWAKKKLKIFRNVSLLEGDIKQFDFKNESFGCCLCLDVLEHVEDPPELIGEVNRVLQNGAQLIISVPNWYDIIVSKILGLNPFHLHAHSPFGWMKIIKKYGFQIASYRCIDFPLIKNESLAKKMPFLGLGIIIIARKIRSI